jgi:hypothetical protein
VGKTLNQDLAAFYPLFLEKEVVERQQVFANQRDIRKRKLSVQMCGLDQNVIAEKAVG